MPSPPPCPQVAAFLRSVLAEACSSGPAAGSLAAPPSPQAVVAEALAQPGVLQLMLAVLRCFTAWTKLGCLLDSDQAAFFASLAGELLFVADSQQGVPYHPLCLPAAVDAASEVIEHATEALQPLLTQLAAALPQRAAALNSSGAEDEAAELAHVFALFCSTNRALCGAEGPEGEALRQVGGAPGAPFCRAQACGAHALSASQPVATAVLTLLPLDFLDFQPSRRACCCCWRCRKGLAWTAAGRLCLP